MRNSRNIKIRVQERTQELATKNQELQATLGELHRTQAKLIQSEKMSSLGQLVGGVAHEINNPISFIYGNLRHTDEYTESLLDLLQLYQKYYPQPESEIVNKIKEIDLEYLQDDLPKIFASMRNGAERVKDIVLSLRNFARLDEADYKQVEIHEGLNNTLMILQQKFKDIQIIKEYAKLPEVHCYVRDLNQVFLNIISNAIDAISSANQDKPTIKIKTELRENNQISICITDNGIGINPENLTKIFDPFFTTKPVGQGAGLGLFISHQIIVEQHRGQLLCSSQMGVCTEFYILLPQF